MLRSAGGRGNIAMGARAESLVASWYEENGFSVLARNWSCKSGEIDIVASDGRLIVFCEVKARSSERYGSASEAVTVAKQRRVRTAAREYLHAARSSRGRGLPQGLEVRFDVALVVASSMEIIEAAF